jgi:hypothetical protein
VGTSTPEDKRQSCQRREQEDYRPSIGRRLKGKMLQKRGK